MRTAAIGTCVIMVLVPASLFGTTSLWTEAEVWSGTNVATLSGNVTHGTITTESSNIVSETLDGRYYYFSGASSSRCECASLSTSLKMLSFSNTYPVQYVAAKAAFTNTAAVCGPAGTGTVSYTVSLYTMDFRLGSALGVASNSFELKHNGQSVQFGLFHDMPPIQTYTSMPQTITFGVPFAIMGSIASRISCPQTQGFGDSTTLLEYKFSLDSITVQDGQGITVTDRIFTITSEGGSPYPKGPELFVDSFTGTNVTLFWHSITDRTYQVQYSTNLLGNLWTNLGGAISGSGTTNVTALPMIEEPRRFYRLVAP